ncbi:hypothetical protein Tco_0709275, partial [Tanacetum coccineum]
MNESPLHAVHSHGSAEGSLKLNELTTLVTRLSEKIGVLEDDLTKTKLTYSAAVTKLILRVKKLETKLKAGTARKRARVVLSKDDEDVEDDSSKQGRKLSDAEDQEKASTETEPIIQEVRKEILNTAGRTVTYRRRSEEKMTRKDKGKAIMTEPEPKKKSKKELEQERYHALKIKPKIIAQAGRNMIKYLKNLGNYKISDFKGMSYNEIRPIFEKVWDFNQHIEPMDEEHRSEKMKSPEKIEEEDVDTQKEMKVVFKESGAKRKKSLPRKSTRSKRQKMEEDAEKEELKGFLEIIPKDDIPIEVESLSTKYPIVDWKTYILSETFMYYKIIRGDGSSKNYKILSEMLEDFDRQDVEELYRLVKERYSASRPEG